jgi:hypothetical protein
VSRAKRPVAPRTTFWRLLAHEMKVAPRGDLAIWCEGLLRYGEAAGREGGHTRHRRSSNAMPPSCRVFIRRAHGRGAYRHGEACSRRAGSVKYAPQSRIRRWTRFARPATVEGDSAGQRRSICWTPCPATRLAFSRSLSNLLSERDQVLGPRWATYSLPIARRGPARREHVRTTWVRESRRTFSPRLRALSPGERGGRQPARRLGLGSPSCARSSNCITAP